MSGCPGDVPSRPYAFVETVVVLRRKSWVTAIPIEAKARDVRIQARKVRSISSS